jgi:hypothetical protein
MQTRNVTQIERRGGAQNAEKFDKNVEFDALVPRCWLKLTLGTPVE